MSSHDGLSPFRTVRQAYDHLEETGAIARDPAQMEVVEALDRLIEELSVKRMAAKKSALGWLFAKKRPAHEPVKGLYVHGEVGRGKTMLMDLFFELVPARRKRRAHFNDFMADVHDRIQKHREKLKRGETKETDPIPPVARALAEEAWVLCFDEFTVTDIADAMVLSRLFSSLFAEGVVLVATSNVAPRDLYRDGLNRGLFEPFIGILERHAKVLNLDGPTDHRRRRLERMQVYITPLDEAADRLMDEAWSAATAGRNVHEDRIALKGREIVVPRAAGTAARFDFAQLCGAALAARDYLALVARYDTLFLDHIPVMGQDRRNEAKRFILLVDTLYDNRVRLVASAEAAPEALYRGTVGAEVFEFARTASRLTEMQSREWLEGARRRDAAE
ncbi:MAG: cell division protein ZapE [Aquamicrobium sp.]|uniref:cell division protein ZapE n=1 Tax=Aquamicrobium sp. TaxID=1872579 RepID=UPI00349E61B5|nr:cell division protein ZapE [Aquamicrobium sp.]